MFFVFFFFIFHHLFLVSKLVQLFLQTKCKILETYITFFFLWLLAHPYPTKRDQKTPPPRAQQNQLSPDHIHEKMAPDALQNRKRPPALCPRPSPSCLVLGEQPLLNAGCGQCGKCTSVAQTSGGTVNTGRTETLLQYFILKHCQSSNSGKSRVHFFST